MALRTPWDSTVEGVQRASTLRPEVPARTPFNPMVERLAPAPNDPRLHGDGRYGGTPNPPNPGPQPAAATPSPAAAVAEAPAAEAAAKKGGWFRRAASAAGEAANTLRNVPGKAVGLLDVDIAPALRAVPGKVAAAANSTLGRAALPVSVGMSALGSADTSTAEYERRTGLRGGDMPSDLGVRAAGVAQDLGNNLTFGVADRVGNLIAGNGFNRSAGNQVGELFGPGREVGGSPQPSAPATQSVASTDPRAATSWGARPGVSAPAGPAGGTVDRVGNSFSGENVQTGFGYTGAGRPTGLTSEQGGGGLRGGGTVSSLDTREGYRQDQMEVGRLRAERAEREAQPMGGVTGIYSPSGTESFGKSLSVLGSGNMKPRDIRAANALRSEMDIAHMRERGETVRAGASQNNGLRIAELNNATARRSNDQNNQTSLRGQDMELEGRMAPMRQQQALRDQTRAVTQAATSKDGVYDPTVAQALAARAGIDPKPFREQVEAAQGQSAAQKGLEKSNVERSRALFNGSANFMIPPGEKGADRVVAQKALEDKAHALAGQHIKGFDTLPEGEQKRLMPKVMGMLEIIEKTGVADRDIFSHILAGEGSVPDSNGLRESKFFEGGKVGSPYGLAAAAFSRYEKGDVNFTTQGGGSLRIPNPSVEAQAFLDDMAKGRDPFAKAAW